MMRLETEKKTLSTVSYALWFISTLITHIGQSSYPETLGRPLFTLAVVAVV
jgi:hypothetical protein